MEGGLRRDEYPHARLPQERAPRPHQGSERNAEDDRVDAQDKEVPPPVLLGRLRRPRRRVMSRPAPGAGHDMRHTLLAVVAVLVAMVSFQTGASLAKQLFPLVGPVGTTLLRLGFGALILCAIWRPWRHKLTRAELRTIVIYGVAMGGM